MSKKDQDKFFSYFEQDTLPKATTCTEKNTYGISKGVKKDEKEFKKRHYTIEMQNVYPTVDSMETTATRISSDSASIISPEK